MSYSRYSDMGFRCDLYVYAGDKGLITVHVATYRRVWDPPETYESLIRAAAGTPEREWNARRDAWYAALDAAPFEPVDHPLSGSSVRELAPAAALWLCERLIADGLRAPESLLPALRADAEADAAAAD